MRPQHHHVLPAAAPVLLAVGVHRLHVADPAACDRLPHGARLRQVHPLVGDGDLLSQLLRPGDQEVSVGEVGGHRFLAVHVGSGLQAGGHQLDVAVGPARADADDVELLAGEHPLVIGIGARGAGLLLRLCPALLVRVAHGDELDAFVPLVRQVQPVAEAARPGVADGRGPVGPFRHDFTPSGSFSRAVNLAGSALTCQSRTGDFPGLETAHPVQKTLRVLRPPGLVADDPEKRDLPPVLPGGDPGAA